MPRYVVERANEILGQLEQKSIDTGDLDEKVKKINAPAMQLSFFDAEPDPVLMELKEQLEEVDLNRLTPIECMLKLDELKKLLD
jgi:DNA mismatch repair protein MutS